MKKLIYTTVLLAAFALTEKVAAQGFLSVHQSSAAGYHGDTVIASSTVTFSVYLENSGNAPVAGPVDILIHLAIVDSVGTFTALDTVPVQIPLGTTLQNGDTIGFPITHNINMQKYMLDGNTTVIWPIAPGLDNDSLWGDVWVVEPIGVIEGTGKQQMLDIRCYPNPTQDFLFLDVPAQAELKGIRIIDLTGKTVRQFGNLTRLPVGDLPSGIYFAEMEFRSGQIQTYKIIKKSR